MRRVTGDPRRRHSIRSSCLAAPPSSRMPALPLSSLLDLLRGRPVLTQTREPWRLRLS